MFALPFGSSFDDFPYQRQEGTNGYAVDCLSGCHFKNKPPILLSGGSREFQKAYPYSKVPDAAVRKIRKAVREEKHAPARCFLNCYETSNSGSGGIDFAHFPEKIF